MYCKNCGNAMDPNAVICVKCGYAKGTGNTYCPNCGQQTLAESVVCVSCGSSLKASAKPSTNAKSKLAAGLLGIFLGSLGVHNFYLGYTGKAIAQLLISVLSCGTLAVVSSVWGLIEGIFYLTGKYNTDAAGVPLAD